MADEKENTGGNISLGLEISTESLESQAPKVEKAAEKAGKRAGEKAGEAAGKGLSSKSGTITTAAETSGKRAGSAFHKRFSASATGGLGAIAGKITKILAGAFAAKKIFDFGKTAISLGSDLAEVQNVVDSTFGQGSSAQKAVNEFAQNAATQFGLSETMAKRYAGTFGAMSKAFGFANDDAAEMSTRLTGLAGDVASFYNITQDEAYTKLKSVFTGETESLKDLGVVMTQTALDQYALQSGFGRTTKDMTEMEKVTLRYNFVLDKLNTASGDFARTSDGWANQVRLLKLQFESLAATIGQVLITALTPAIKALNTFMGALIKTANTFKSFVYSLFGKSSEDMTAGAGASTEALENISSGASDAADSLGDVGDAATGAGKDASSAANEIKRSLASFDKITKLSDTSSSSGGSSGSGSSGSSGSGSSGSSLGDTSSALQNTAYSIEATEGPLDNLISKFNDLKNLFVGGFWEGFGDTAVFDSIQTSIESIGTKLKNIFTDDSVTKAASDCADKIVTSLGEIAGSVASIGATIADNLLGGFDKFLEEHEEEIKQFFVNVLGDIGDIFETIGNFTADVAEVFTVFRSDKAKQLTADIIACFSAPFATVIELATSFASDVISNVTKPFTDNKESIKTALDNSIGQIGTVVSGIKSTVETFCETAKKLYDEHISPLLDSLGDGISDIVGTFLDAWNNHVSPVLDDLATKAKEVFENHINPAIEAGGKALGAIVDVVQKFWENIMQPFVKFLVEELTPVLAPIAEVLGGAILKAVGDVADQFKTFSGWVETAAKWLGDLLTLIGNVDFSKIAEDIKKLPGKITMTIVDNASDWLSGIKTWWDKNKPSWSFSAVLGVASKLGEWWKENKPTKWSFTATLGVLSKLGEWWKEHKPTKWKFTATLGVTSTLGEWWKKHKPSWSTTVSVAFSFADKFSDWWDKHKPSAPSLSTTLHIKVPTIEVKWKTVTAFGKKFSVPYDFKIGWKSHAKGGIFDGATMMGMTGNTAHIAGEAGKEALLPLDRHTEWMDKVAKRVVVQQQDNGFFNADAYLPRLADVGNGIRSETAQLVQLARQAEAAGSGSNELMDILREILKLLESLDTDVYIDGQKVTSRIVNIINDRTKATGRSTVIV